MGNIVRLKQFLEETDSANRRRARLCGCKRQGFPVDDMRLRQGQCVGLQARGRECPGNGAAAPLL